jgi:cyanophycinase
MAYRNDPEVARYQSKDTFSRMYGSRGNGAMSIFMLSSRRNGYAIVTRTRYEEVIMTTSANGTVALIGAGEYLPAILPVDKMLLERLNGTPRVVVLPTASVPDGAGVPERWARMGVEHFAQMGVTAEPIMLLNRTDAENADVAARLAGANFIYFSGGKPRYLLETLQGTTAWKAILDVFAAGGIVAGCSAGAMVLGGLVFDFPQVWRTIPALGLVPGIAVIPHFDELPSWLAGTIARSRRKVTIVGIDGATALVGSNDQWVVYGRGSVTVFTENGKKRYVESEAVPLDIS